MSPSFSSPRERIDRIRARAWALQILYAWEAGGGEVSFRDSLVDTMAHRRIAPRRVPYIRQVMQTLDAHREEIDERVRSALDNWTLERLAAVDRAVLRLGAAEILYMEDIPPRVSIQECLRLAEQYGGPESPRFVNGVLDALYRGFLETASS